MVSENVKVPPLQKVSKMFDGEVNGQKFAVKCAVSGLHRF